VNEIIKVGIPPATKFCLPPLKLGEPDMITDDVETSANKTKET